MSDKTKPHARPAQSRKPAKHKGKASGTSRKPTASAKGQAARPRPSVASTEGLAPRELAVELIDAVLSEKRPFDEAWAALLKKPGFHALEARDRGLARSIAANALRYARPLETVLAHFIDKPLPAKQSRVFAILLATATQLLLLKTPPHAAINIAVDQTQKNKNSAHLSKFVNAVLRRVSEKGAALLSEIDQVKEAYPGWLWQRWVSAYGDETARAIAIACLNEAPLDITPKDAGDASRWANEIGAILLETGSLRYADGGRTDELPGFAEGAWWVQDVAAALPARLLGNVEGKTIADICAAPGGKTAQLAAAGAKVTAVDISSARLKRVRENLDRLQLSAELVEADAAEWSPEKSFNAILLDAPCTATGTIRRHPDILHLKQPSDIAALAELQKRVLQNVARFVSPGGLIVYCTCSLEPEEGEQQVDAFLSAHPEFERVPVSPGEAGIRPGWITPDGDLRTLPCHSPVPLDHAGDSNSEAEPTDDRDAARKTGMDGFFAARLKKRG